MEMFQELVQGLFKSAGEVKVAFGRGGLFEAIGHAISILNDFRVNQAVIAQINNGERRMTYRKKNGDEITLDAIKAGRGSILLLLQISGPKTVTTEELRDIFDYVLRIAVEKLQEELQKLTTSNDTGSVQYGNVLFTASEVAKIMEIQAKDLQGDWKFFEPGPYLVNQLAIAEDKVERTQQELLETQQKETSKGGSLVIFNASHYYLHIEVYRYSHDTNEVSKRAFLSSGSKQYDPDDAERILQAEVVNSGDTKVRFATLRSCPGQDMKVLIYALTYAGMEGSLKKRCFALVSGPKTITPRINQKLVITDEEVKQVAETEEIRYELLLPKSGRWGQRMKRFYKKKASTIREKEILKPLILLKDECKGMETGGRDSGYVLMEALSGGEGEGTINTSAGALSEETTIG